jgi:hypothetical protein
LYWARSPSRCPSRFADLLHDPGVDRADEEDSDALSVQAVRDQHRVCVLDERAQRRVLAGGLGAALARRVELCLEPVHVALQGLLLGVVHFPAHGDADEDADDERDEDCREGCNVVAEVKHGRLQSGSSLAKGVQSGERLAGQWSQALEYCARAGAVDGQGRASHALGGGLEDELRGEALLNVVPGEPALGLDRGDDENAL